MSRHHSARLGNGEREETGLTAAGVVAKTEPCFGQNSCCFWSAAQWAWSNAVWETDWHHADWTFLTWPLHLDSARFTSIHILRSLFLSFLLRICIV